jgi:arylsulfatase A-like enzyme
VNIILVVSDTFRRDNLACYGPTRVQAPRLNHFADEANVFENAYLGSFPTIPNRLDVMSGRFSFIDHQWCPLPAETVTLQQILSAAGVTTQLVCDNPHLMEAGFNYERGYDAWEWVRGQSTDAWRNTPHKVPPINTVKNRTPWVLRNYLRNTAWWSCEEDRFAARTVNEACRWLERAAPDLDNFFLHVDIFDPHEPWDAPMHYVDLYDPDYQGEQILFPHTDYWRDFLTEPELNHLRAEYMAEASMVDHWFGVLLDKVEELGLAEDTAVIFTSDHGYLFGEHNLTGKSRLPVQGDTMYFESIRMYDELRRLPLLIRLPGQHKGQRIPALVQSPDLMPTILEMAGLVSTEMIGGEAQIQALQCGAFFSSKWQFQPETVHGKSLMPLIEGKTRRLRDIAVCSNALTMPTPVVAKSAIVTEDGWCLHYAGKYPHGLETGTWNTCTLVGPSTARVPTEPALFDLKSDPTECDDVIAHNRPLAQDIHRRYVAWLEQVGTSEQYLAGRRELD